MTDEQVLVLGPAFTDYLRGFRSCFVTKNTFAHLGTYARGLLSNLPRKSVEPIALAGGAAVRTLQEFLTHHAWDHGRMRDQMQRAASPASICHRPATSPPAGSVPSAGLTRPASPRRGTRPRARAAAILRGQRQTRQLHRHRPPRLPLRRFLGHARLGPVPARGLMGPGPPALQASAHPRPCVIYSSKWLLALDQVKRAMANGVRFDWLTFDEWYGGKPEFLRGLEDWGLLYVCEAPKNLPCFPSLPKYKSLQRPFASKPVESAGKYAKPFKGKSWKKVRLARKTLGDQVWEVRTNGAGVPVARRQTHRPHLLADRRARARAQRAVPRVARSPVGAFANHERRVDPPVSPGPKSGRPIIPPTCVAETGVAL